MCERSLLFRSKVSGQISQKNIFISSFLDEEIIFGAFLLFIPVETLIFVILLMDPGIFLLPQDLIGLSLIIGSSFLENKFAELMSSFSDKFT